MNELQLTITIDEANLILESLGQQPFIKVFSLIQKIQQQASQQLNEGTQQDAPLHSFSKPEDDASDKKTDL